VVEVPVDLAGVLGPDFGSWYRPRSSQTPRPRLPEGAIRRPGLRAPGNPHRLRATRREGIAQSLKVRGRMFRGHVTIGSKHRPMPTSTRSSRSTRPAATSTTTRSSAGRADTRSSRPPAAIPPRRRSRSSSARTRSNSLGGRMRWLAGQRIRLPPRTSPAASLYRSAHASHRAALRLTRCAGSQASSASTRVRSIERPSGGWSSRSRTAARMGADRTSTDRSGSAAQSRAAGRERTAR
jgi:hypothetical protein